MGERLVDRDLVGAIADAASGAVWSQGRAISANANLLKSVSLEIEVTPKGAVTVVDSYISRRVRTDTILGVRRNVAPLPRRG